MDLQRNFFDSIYFSMTLKTRMKKAPSSDGKTDLHTNSDIYGRSSANEWLHFHRTPRANQIGSLHAAIFGADLDSSLE